MSDYRILINNDRYICVNKAAGVLSQPGKSGEKSVKEILENRLKKPLHIINRLDRPVSGILLFAKNKKSAKRLTATIQSEHTHKIYIAIVDNKPPEEEGILNDSILVRNSKAYITSSDEIGKNAILNYKILGNSKNYHFLEISLITGRFHQIRTQLAHVGCHIMGDVKYGARRSNKNRSIGLHAWKLSFVDPFIGERIIIKAEFPQDPIWLENLNIIENQLNN